MEHKNAGFYQQGQFWIETYTGKRVNPARLEYQEADICIEDIAHSLSLTNRFTGHSKIGISVAEHSLLVMNIVDTALADKPKDYATRLIALLHDAEEAYFGDISRPMKAIFPIIKEQMERARGVIFRALSVPAGDWELVHRADVRARGIGASQKAEP